MLNVEKKKPRRGGRRLAAACLGILLLAGGAAAWLLGREQAPVPARQETGGTLQAREKGSITRMTIRVRGREPWTAVRDSAGRLVMADGGGWALDETLAERIENALENLVYEDILAEDPEMYRDRLAEFGLADPALTAEAEYDDGEKITVLIGDPSGLEDADYRFMLVEGDGRLYAAAGSLAEDLTVEKELLHPVPQPEIQTARLDRISVLDGAGNIRAEWTLRGDIADADAAENWTVRGEGIRYPADQDRISSLKKNVGNLRLGLYVAEAGEDGALAARGLENPDLFLEIHMAAGATGLVDGSGAYDVTERAEETLRFAVGNSRNEMTDYVLYDDVIYTVNHFILAAVTETDPLSTACRYPFSVAAEALSALTVERADGSRTEYVLTRTSVPSEDGEAPDETLITCRKNGEAYPWETFLAAYERMRVTTVSGRLPADWEKQESETVYTFRTVSGKTHTLELSPFDDLHDAVTADGETLFYLIRGGLGQDP